VTYSIVARDRETGELGVAVQTGTFGVGRGVPWAEAGVGAVATQSITEPSHGPFGLELMKGGRSAQEALTGLVASDPKQRFRQVGIVDANGNAAAHTGDGCIKACGHLVGDGYAVQANMMGRDTVWPAMAAAYEGAEGPLTRRLLAALEAAETEGGDFRGAQSAAILVVQAEPTGFFWRGRVSNLRVDDHVDPVGELGRLLDLEEDYRAERGEHLRDHDRRWAEAEQAARDGDVARARELLQPAVRSASPLAGRRPRRRRVRRVPRLGAGPRLASRTCPTRSTSRGTTRLTGCSRPIRWRF
jgi:uncharacterized Ntn-hydrolase superfamily protein